MKTRLILLVVLTGVLTLTACGDQVAIDRAKADQIRQQAADEHAAKVTAEARKQADWESTQAARDSAKEIGYLLLTIALVVVVVFLVGVGAFYLWQQVRARSLYALRQAAAKADLVEIKIDRGTMTWPLLVSRGAIHNPQVGQVARIGQPQPPDPQLAAGDSLIRSIRVVSTGLTKMAERTNDSAGPADALGNLAGALPQVQAPRRSDLSGDSAGAGAERGGAVIGPDDAEIIDL